MEKIIATKKGIYIKKLENFGGIIFSPYSGLFFAIAEDYINEVIAYCNNEKATLPIEIINHINIEIDKKEQKTFEVKHWLPEKDCFSNFQGFPPVPIVINWLISNQCNFNCNYCYASDVMNNKYNEIDIKEISHRILNKNPLTIVLSGGEPLLEKKKVANALSEIGGKVGIMVDTNGYIFDIELASLFKKYNVVVRVSLDALRSKENIKLRPPKKDIQKDTLPQIINNISKYRELGITVLIHTVITPVNIRNLEDMYKKLPAISVNGWRLFSVVNPNDKKKQEDFQKVMSYRHSKSIKDGQKIIYNWTKKQEQSFLSKSNFSVQIVQSSETDKNSVVLVLPNGEFATENLFINEKNSIDPNQMSQKVDFWGHYKRYLGAIK